VAVGDFDLAALAGARGRVERMKPVSRYPTVKYDVAVIAEKTTPAAQVEDALRRADPELVREVRLFDAYEGPSLPAGKRSLAFSLAFGSFERTLEPADVERLRARVEAVLKERGWTLRS
jgi:phenylalanyl-tRNA synthetase beta chain